MRPVLDGEAIAASQGGFTLLELSIVLVIIGLIAGGILVGRDLIHAAQLRSVLTGIDQFKTAVQTFQGKYNCLPGDCSNATSFWGADPGGCPDTPASSVPKMETCNGNGNGMIASDPMGVSDNLCEQHRFWQQLSDAQLIPGAYTGVFRLAPCNGDDVEGFAGINVPAGKLSGSIFAAHYYSHDHWINAGSPGALSPAALNHNYLVVSGTVSGYWIAASGNAIFSPQDAYALDGKLDDGLPNTGSVLALQLMFGEGAEGECVSRIWANAPSQYVVSNTQIKCSLAFQGGF